MVMQTIDISINGKLRLLAYWSNWVKRVLIPGSLYFVG